MTGRAKIEGSLIEVNKIIESNELKDERPKTIVFAHHIWIMNILE